MAFAWGKRLANLGLWLWINYLPGAGNGNSDQETWFVYGKA